LSEVVTVTEGVTSAWAAPSVSSWITPAAATHFATCVATARKA
jgi:hypothetical protein